MYVTGIVGGGVYLLALFELIMSELNILLIAHGCSSGIRGTSQRGGVKRDEPGSTTVLHNKFF